MATLSIGTADNGEGAELSTRVSPKTYRKGPIIPAILDVLQRLIDRYESDVSLPAIRAALFGLGLITSNSPKQYSTGQACRARRSNPKMIVWDPTGRSKTGFLAWHRSERGTNTLRGKTCRSFRNSRKAATYPQGDSISES